MNEIGYVLQQLWFGATRRKGRKEVLFLAPESVAVADFRNVTWLQGLIAVSGSSAADTLVEMLILGLAGLSLGWHIVNMSEELQDFLFMFFRLFAF